MKLIIDVLIYCDDPKHVYANMRKQHEVKMAPEAGTYLEDAVWSDDKKIEQVTFIPEESSYLITFGEEILTNETTCQRRVEVYEANCWKRASDCI